MEDALKRGTELSDEARHFLATYELAEAGSVLAVYWRYHRAEAEEFDTVDEAVRFLEDGEDSGTLSSAAVVDGDRVITDPELRDLRWTVSAWNVSSNS